MLDASRSEWLTAKRSVASGELDLVAEVFALAATLGRAGYPLLLFHPARLA